MKINLVATGGTIGSRLVNGEYVISDEATEQIAAFIGANKVFGEFKIHSAGIEFADLNTLRLTIERALLDNPDGVIVTHGTDTLAYYSAYLAFAFSSTRVPIVMCAADNPLTNYDSNGFVVLKAAKSLIESGKRGVFVLYKNPGAMVTIHHGARLIPAHLHEDFYFSLGGGNAFADTGLMHGMDFDLSGHKVLCIEPYVGMDYSSYNLTGYSAVVQVAYHSGKVNVEAFNRFAAAHPEIPMFLSGGKKKYAPDVFVKNVTICNGMTQTALYIKLLIGLKNNVKDLAAFVMKNACGEIVEK
ncbi:MAG: asparaginase [Clostridiales bacterium]|nr:asparaginase [Clostridiales bacterium]